MTKRTLKVMNSLSSRPSTSEGATTTWRTCTLDADLRGFACSRVDGRRASRAYRLSGFVRTVDFLPRAMCPGHRHSELDHCPLRTYGDLRWEREDQGEMPLKYWTCRG